MSDIVLLCNCGVSDPANLNRPWLHFTSKDIATLTKDHPVTAVGMCETCKCTAYIMRKCICKDKHMNDYIGCQVEKCKYQSPSDATFDGMPHCELQEITIKVIDGKPVCQCYKEAPY